MTMRRSHGTYYEGLGRRVSEFVHVFERQSYRVLVLAYGAAAGVSHGLMAVCALFLNRVPVHPQRG